MQIKEIKKLNKLTFHVKHFALSANKKSEEFGKERA